MSGIVPILNEVFRTGSVPGLNERLYDLKTLSLNEAREQHGGLDLLSVKTEDSERTRQYLEALLPAGQDQVSGGSVWGGYGGPGRIVPPFTVLLERDGSEFSLKFYLNRVHTDFNLRPDGTLRNFRSYRMNSRDEEVPCYTFMPGNNESVNKILNILADCR